MFSEKIYKKIIFSISIVIIFLIHQLIFQHYLNLGKYHFDYQSVLSRLLFGKIWFLNNGFSIPWFTPHICCGLPFYANPQSEFYSLPQFLIFFFKPLNVFKIVFFIYSLIAFSGIFLLLRKIFKFDYIICLLGSTLLLFSHYYSFHYLAGHIAWGLTTFTPLFFLLCCYAFNNHPNHQISLIYILLSGLFFAMIIHGGGSRVLTDLLLSTFFMMLIHIYVFNNYKIISFTALPILIGLIISSSKIYSSLSFLSNISKRNLEHIYFNSLYDFVLGIFKLFFLIPNLSLKDHYFSKWNFTIEELSFNVTIIPLLLFVLYLRTFPKFKKTTPSRISIYVFFLTLIVLILSNFSNTLIGSFIVSLPIINLDWISFRLLASLIIPLCIFSCFMIKQLNFKKINYAVTVCIAIIISQNLLFDKTIFYKALKHDISDFMNFEINNKNIEKFRIDKIYSEVTTDYKYLSKSSHENFLNNKSVQFCYFPILGYDLDILKPIVNDLVFSTSQRAIKYDQEIRILEGDPLLNNQGNLNFINPSCYTNPDQTECKKDYYFKAHQKDELIKFLNYKKFNFEHLKSQVFFNLLSVFTLIFSILITVYLIISNKIKQKKTPNSKS